VRDKVENKAGNKAGNKLLRGEERKRELRNGEKMDV